MTTRSVLFEHVPVNSLVDLIGGYLFIPEYFRLDLSTSPETHRKYQTLLQETLAKVHHRIFRDGYHPEGVWFPDFESIPINNDTALALQMCCQYLKLYQDKDLSEVYHKLPRRIECFMSQNDVSWDPCVPDRLVDLYVDGKPIGNEARQNMFSQWDYPATLKSHIGLLHKHQRTITTRKNYLTQLLEKQYPVKESPYPTWVLFPNVDKDPEWYHRTITHHDQKLSEVATQIQNLEDHLWILSYLGGAPKIKEEEKSNLGEIEIWKGILSIALLLDKRITPETLGTLRWNPEEIVQPFNYATAKLSFPASPICERIHSLLVSCSKDFYSHHSELRYVFGDPESIILSYTTLGVDLSSFSPKVRPHHILPVLNPYLECHLNIIFEALFDIERTPLCTTCHWCGGSTECEKCNENLETPLWKMYREIEQDNKGDHRIQIFPKECCELNRCGKCAEIVPCINCLRFHLPYERYPQMVDKLGVYGEFFQDVVKRLLEES